MGRRPGEASPSGGCTPRRARSHPHIQAIVDALRPAYDVAIHEAGNLVDNMVRAQTELTVARLRTDPLIHKFIARGELGVVGGYYSLDTGAVSIIA